MDGVDPLVAPVLCSFEQAREDLSRYTEGLSTEQIWASPYGFGSVGFHIRHIAGSTTRLMTYLEGAQLSEAQLASLEWEAEPGAPRKELLRDLAESFQRAEEILRGLRPEKLWEPRDVGRKRLPSTVIGLLFHISEHTQRHVGQAISAAKLARARTR
jgi:uncharacterized damage-inducible protein DinB